jgi:hypothetical protein
MNIRKYKVGDLRRVIKESADEFKPKFGKNVESDNKKINDKAYKEISKETKAYDGGLKSEDPKGKLGDAPTAADNKGMQDLEYLNMSPDFKKRVKAQIKGYPSANAEKEHKDEPFGNAVFGNDKEYDELAKRAKNMKDMKDTGKEIGLTGREINKNKFKDLNDTMFESKKMKKLTFKHTTFLSENHMLTRVPDDYKSEGNKFIMRDNSDNEYIVEWHEDKPEVTKQLNRTKLEEEKARIKQLYNYKSQEYFTSTNGKMRMNETKNFSDMLGRARSLMK